MDHRAVIAALTPEQRDRLTAKSDLAGLRHLVLHWGAIAILGSLIAVRAPLWPSAERTVRSRARTGVCCEPTPAYG